MTTELIGVIQEIVKNYIKVVRLTDKATGTVLTEAPLSVQVDASIPPISGPALLLTDSVRERTELVKGGAGGTVTVTEGLKAGDKVLMLQVKGGQQYIILSKLR